MYEGPLTYPAACPACGNRDGIPTNAIIGNTHESVVVTLRCRSCFHVWNDHLERTQVNGESVPTKGRAGEPIR